jgi:hypothetical protein
MTETAPPERIWVRQRVDTISGAPDGFIVSTRSSIPYTEHDDDVEYVLASAQREVEAKAAMFDDLVTHLQLVFDYYMGEHACGDFTCDCGEAEYCGPCNMREITSALLADAALATAEKEPEVTR